MSYSKITCSRCGEASPAHLKFCTKCGYQFAKDKTSTVGKILCYNCGNKVPISSRCNNCNSPFIGTIAPLRFIQKIDKDLDRISYRLDSIDEKISNIPELRRVPTSERVDITEYTEEAEEEFQLSEERIHEDSLTLHIDPLSETEELPITDGVGEDLEVEEVATETEIIEEDIVEEEIVEEELYKEPEEIVEEIEPEPEILIAPPVIPNPTLYPISFYSKPVIEEVQLPTRVHPSTKVIELDFRAELREFIEGPLLTSIGIFGLIIAMLFLSIATDTSPEESGIIFGLLGLGVCFIGYLLIEGKMVGIKDKQYGLGLFFVMTGFLLGVSINFGAINDLSVLLVLIVGLIVFTNWIGYVNESETLMSVTTIFGFLTAAIMAQATSGQANWSFFLFGGGAIWFAPFAAFAAIAGMREKSVFPAILVLLLGPTFSITIVRSADSVILPSLGIIVSIIPIALLLMRGQVELFPVYLRSTYALLFIWPTIAYFIQFTLMDEASIYNHLMVFISFGVFYHLSTASLYGKRLVSGVVQKISAEMDRYTRVLTVFIGYFVVTLSLQESTDYPDLSDYILQVLIPAGLFITITGLFVLYSNLKIFSRGSLKSFAFSLSLTEYTILGYSINIARSDIHETISAIFIMSIIFLSVLGGIIVHFQSHHFNQLDDILLLAAMGTLVNEFLLTIIALDEVWAIISAYAGLSLFTLSIILPKVQDYERIRLNQISLFGNFTVIGAIQIFTGKYDTPNRSIEGFSVGPFIVYFGYLVMVSLTGLILHKYRVPRRFEIKGIFGLSDKEGNYLVRLSTWFEKKLLQYQEISMNTFLNFLMLIFILRDGFKNSTGAIFVLLISTPIFLAITFIARKGNWMTLIPSLLPLVVFSILLSIDRSSASDTDRNQMLVIHGILALYVILGGIISRLDKVEKREGHYSRAYRRDIVLWVTVLLTLSTGAAHYWYSILLIVLLMQLVTFLVDKYRGQFFATGLTLLGSAVVLSRLNPNVNDYRDIAGYLGIFSILLVYIIYAIQYSGKHSIVDKEIIISPAVESLFDRFDLDQDFFKKNLLTLRNLLPIAVSLFMLIPVQLGWSISSFYFILITLGYIVLSEISHVKSKLIWLAISLMHINYGIHLIWGDKPDLRENEGYVFLVVLAIFPIYLLYLAYSDKQMDELSRRDNQISGVLLSIYSIFILAFMQFLGLDLKFSIYYTIMLSVFLFILYTAHSEKPYDGISIVILLTVIGFFSQLYDNINIAYKLLPFFIGAIFLIYSSVVSEKADHNFGALISIAFIFNFIFNFSGTSDFGSDTVRGVGIDVILAVLLTGSYIFHHYKHNSPITEIAAGITVIIGALTLGNAPGFLAARKIFPLIFVFQIAKSYWTDRRSEDVDLKEEIAAKFGLTVIYFFFVNFEFEQELFYILVIGLGALMMDFVRVRSSSDHFSFSLSYIWLLFGSWFLRGFEVQKPEFIAISLLIGPIVMLLAHQAKVSGNADWFNYALLTSLITFAFATIGYSDSNNDLLAFTTLLLLLPLTYIIWTSNDENVVNYSIVSLAIVATVIPTESAYLAVLTIFVNISYTLINSFLKTTKTFSSHSSLFGPVAIWLGVLLGTDWVYSATKIDLFWKQLAGQEALLDYLWITMYFMGFIAISRDYLQRSKESSDEEAPIYSNPLFYLWLLLTSWVLRNPSGNDHAFIALSILVGPCLLLLAETTKNTGKSDWYVGGLITALVVFSFGRFDRGYTDPRDLMFSTIILLVTLTYIIWTSKDDRIINLSIASLGVLAIVLPPESAILVVFTVFANISYMFLKSFLQSDDVPTSRSYLFGALILWLGRVLGESEKVWTYVDDQPDSPLNFLWITMFLFWLVAANLEISTTGTIFIKFESEGDERADVILKGKIDSLSFTWVSFAVISILWADLVEEALDVIVLTIVIAAIISLAVFLFDQNLKLETSFSYHLLIGSYILFSMVGWNLIRKLSDTSSWANALESMNIGRSSFHHIHSVFTLLPLSIAVFLILYRSRIDFPISDPQTLPVGLILATWGPLIAGWRYTKSFESDFTPILFVNLILTFAYLILGSRKNNPLTTSIATIMIYVQAFMLGSSLGLAFVDIDVSVYFVLLISVLVFVFVVISEIREVVNESYKSTIFITVIAQLLILLYIDEGRPGSHEHPGANTLIVFLMALLGTIVYIYGIKFARPLYNNIGMGIIFLNIVRGLIVAVDRTINPPPGGADPVLLFIGFLAVSLNIFVVQGFKNLSQRENLRGVLQLLFEPLERSDDAND